MKPHIRKIKNNTEIPWDLLFLADPSREMIEKYLGNGEISIALVEEKIVGVYVVVNLSDEVYELKNIAVAEEYQGKGIGKMLVQHAIETAKGKKAKQIDVGTGTSSFGPLALYQKHGFRIVGVDKDFFVKNYPEKIIENGIQCRDMIKLSLDLTYET